MREEKTFLASDLADLLKVPRTTINDWLSRYGAFIDFELRGKRKVYFDSSVLVLKEISGLRAEGKNAFDIEKILESRHGVRPEVANAESSRLDDLEDSESRGMLARTTKSDALNIAFPEIKALAEHFEKINRQRQKGLRRGLALIGIFLFLLLLLLGAGGYFAYVHMNSLNSDNRRLLDLVTRQLDENQILQGNLNVLREDGVRQSEELRNAQSQQQKQLKQAIDELRNETVQTKNELSLRQQELLNKIETTVVKTPIISRASGANAESEPLVVEESEPPKEEVKNDLRHGN